MMSPRKSTCSSTALIADALFMMVRLFHAHQRLLKCPTLPHEQRGRVGRKLKQQLELGAEDNFVVPIVGQHPCTGLIGWRAIRQIHQVKRELGAMEEIAVFAEEIIHADGKFIESV